jgi:hypothetical protein
MLYRIKLLPLNFLKDKKQKLLRSIPAAMPFIVFGFHFIQRNYIITSMRKNQFGHEQQIFVPERRKIKAAAFLQAAASCK